MCKTEYWNVINQTKNVKRKTFKQFHNEARQSAVATRK